MLNTRDLEQRWLRYKLKSYIPHVTIAISSLVIVIIVYTFLNSNKREEIVDYPAKIEVAKQIKQAPLIATKVSKSTLEIDEITQIEKIDYKETSGNVTKIPEQTLSYNEDKSLKLAPSLGFMKKMQHSSLPYYQNEVKIEEDVIHPKPKDKVVIVEEVQELDVEESIETAVAKETVVEEKIQKISIERRNTEDDIRHIIKRFKKNNNPALSLFIAKKYYELGEYHRAYNYALITNEIDREIDASWIIFAKSLVKLKQKDMAIKTLKQYIKSTHSSSAKILLDEIVSGKFK